MFDGRNGRILWLSNQLVRLAGGNILDAPPGSACSAGSLADRPCQLLGGDGGNRLKQRDVGYHEAQ